MVQKLTAKTAAAVATAGRISSNASKEPCAKQPKKAQQDAHADMLHQLMQHKQSSTRCLKSSVVAPQTETSGKKRLTLLSDKPSNVRGENILDCQNWIALERKLREMDGTNGWITIIAR